MKIKTYSKGKHTYTQWGKTKKVTHNTAKPLIDYDNTKEFYSNNTSVIYTADFFQLSFFKTLFPSHQNKLQTKILLHYQTAKQLQKNLKKVLQGETE